MEGFAPVTAPEPDASFVVRNSFNLTGRGTCVGGYISSGIIHSGDRLEWSDGSVGRHCICRGVTGVRTVPILDPPTVALLVPDAQPSDFAEGTVIAVYAALA
jgi:translation elongation factor EF-Tu-like GTPase